MKVINVTELKAHLSHYLRVASRGTRVTVKDRNEPIAELGPPQAEPVSWADRLTRAGRLRPGTQRWNTLRITRLGRHVDIQTSVRAVREDPSEIRRR